MLIDSHLRRIPMTKEEFLRRAEDATQSLRDWEDGVAIQMGPAHSRHGFFGSRLMNCIHDHLKSRHAGKVWTELFVDFGPKTYGVDLAVLFSEHLGRDVDGRIYGCPDIIVEVLSPDSAVRDRVDKFEAYYGFGVPWYWIGDAEAGIIEEYRHTPDGYIRASVGTLECPFEPKALPGLIVPIDDLLNL